MDAIANSDDVPTLNGNPPAAAFVAVAEERNFTRAAERLHLVQSAVSASVRNLEGELVDRRLMPIALTDAGRALRRADSVRTTCDSVMRAPSSMGDVIAGVASDGVSYQTHAPDTVDGHSVTTEVGSRPGPGTGG